MPPKMTKYSSADAKHIIALLRSEYGKSAPVLTDGNEGLAHLLALTVVERLSQQVIGRRMTFGHGFARTEAQALAQQHFFEVLVDSQWLLKTMLKELVLSEAFARRAPVQTDVLEYEMQMFAEPLASARPSVGAPSNANGQGDLVHRLPVSTLFSKVHHALRWPAPSHWLAESGPWPTTGVRGRLGARSSHQYPAEEDLRFGTYVWWERSTKERSATGVGYC